MLWMLTAAYRRLNEHLHSRYVTSTAMMRKAKSFPQLDRFQAFPMALGRKKQQIGKNILKVLIAFRDFQATLRVLQFRNQLVRKISQSDLVICHGLLGDGPEVLTSSSGLLMENC